MIFNFLNSWATESSAPSISRGKPYFYFRHVETGFIFGMKVINKASVQAESKEETTKMINQLIR